MKKIDVISDYVKARIQDCSIEFFEAFKKAPISAVQGVVGQEIKTVICSGDKDDFLETINTVKVDPRTGNPGWIVTNPDGEKYVVADGDFHEKYVKDSDDPLSDVYNPIGTPVLVGRIVEDISFIAPWGEEMNIKAGGFLVLASTNDIYGIQEEQFYNTYRYNLESSSTAADKAIKLFGVKQKSLDELIVDAKNASNPVKEENVPSAREEER